MKQTGNEYLGKDLEAMSFAQSYHQLSLKKFSSHLGKVIGRIWAKLAGEPI